MIKSKLEIKMSTLNDECEAPIEQYSTETDPIKLKYVAPKIIDVRPDDIPYGASHPGSDGYGTTSSDTPS